MEFRHRAARLKCGKTAAIDAFFEARRFRALVGAGLFAAGGLAGCGGSVAIGFGYDDFDDRPPRASLAASPDAAAAGQGVRLVAAASDDFGVDAVEFYRLDAGGATLIAVDGQAPYQVDTALPANANGSVEFFARAIDGDGQRGDSAVVTVGVLP